ncbi:MAG: hypothetical protein C5B60_09130 [Chloroflexi bacterium]|nr:MAG: hypothetical protein C5B60_09130 [Chloroflexota bacterium]
MTQATYDYVTSVQSRLTSREFDRLLHRADLARATRRTMLEAMAEENDYADDCEAETGRRYRTDYELYLAANPVYGPLPAPARWVQDGDIPF